MFWEYVILVFLFKIMSFSILLQECFALSSLSCRSTCMYSLNKIILIIKLYLDFKLRKHQIQAITLKYLKLQKFEPVKI